MKHLRSVFNIGDDMVYKIIRDAAEACDLGPVSPHDGRRYYAKRSLKGGAPLEQISETLGHSKLSTTQIYLGKTLEMARGKACGDYINLEIK